MINVLTKIKNNWLVIYWAAFVIFSAYSASLSGYMPRKLRALYPYSYPWLGLIEVCVILAVGIGILHFILRPVPYKRSWKKIGNALLYTGGLLVICVATTGTDMPGLAYVPLVFSSLTFFGFILYALAIAISSALQWVKNAF